MSSRRVAKSSSARDRKCYGEATMDLNTCTECGGSNPSLIGQPHPDGCSSCGSDLTVQRGTIASPKLFNAVGIRTNADGSREAVMLHDKKVSADRKLVRATEGNVARETAGGASAGCHGKGRHGQHRTI